MTKRKRRAWWQKLRSAVCRLMAMQVSTESKILYLEERLEALEKCIDEMCQDGDSEITSSIGVALGKTQDVNRITYTNHPEDA